MSCRILLVEGCEILRSALAQLVENSGTSHEIVLTESAFSALEAYTRLRPSVVLFGPSQITVHGIETLKDFLGNAPDARVVVFVLQDDEEAVARLFRIGAVGAVGTRTSLERFLSCLTEVADGGIYSEYRIDDLLKYFGDKGSSEQSTLAPRETRVLGLVRDGKSSKEIAYELGLGVETVRYYRKSIMRKLKVHNVAELLREASALQLMPERRGRT